jgi:hypothetical protein
MTGNKDIATIGEATQFGAEGGANPSEAAAKSNGGSIRGAVRRIAHMHPDDAKKLADPNSPQATMALIVAATKYQRALKGDVRAMQQLEDSIDGKLVEKQIQAETTLEELVTGSFEHEQREESRAEESQP